MALDLADTLYGPVAFLSVRPRGGENNIEMLLPPGHQLVIALRVYGCGVDQVGQLVLCRFPLAHKNTLPSRTGF